MDIQKHDEVDQVFMQNVEWCINQLNENGIEVSGCKVYKKWADFEFVNPLGKPDIFRIFYYPIDSKVTMDITLTRHFASATLIYDVLGFEQEDYADGSAACNTYIPTKW